MGGNRGEDAGARGTGPDYEMAERLVLTEPAQAKALGHPLRTTILGLLHERAASVSELAVATGRPKSTVAHHVSVLERAGIVQVVRTRRIRAVEERFYGRVASTITLATADRSGAPMPLDFNDFAVAAEESAAAYADRQLAAFLRHGRLSREEATRFWTRIRDLVEEFDRLPRAGDQTYGFAVGIYPIREYPRLPPPGDE